MTGIVDGLFAGPIPEFTMCCVCGAWRRYSREGELAGWVSAA
jgi:hypothetical protein